MLRVDFFILFLVYELIYSRVLRFAGVNLSLRKQEV